MDYSFLNGSVLGVYVASVFISGLAIYSEAESTLNRRLDDFACVGIFPRARGLELDGNPPSILCVWENSTAAVMKGCALGPGLVALLQSGKGV